MAGMFRDAARSASRTASPMVRRSTPGMDVTGCRPLAPSTTKIGQIRSLAVSTFSHTSRLDHSALRLRRRRCDRFMEKEGASSEERRGNGDSFDIILTRRRLRCAGGRLRGLAHLNLSKKGFEVAVRPDPCEIALNPAMH